MQNAVLTGFGLAGIDRDGAPRVYENDAARLVQLAGKLLFLFAAGVSLEVRNPMIEEIIGLRF